MRGWVAGLALLAAACSKGGSDESASTKAEAPKSTADACGLITAAEAQTLLGGSASKLEANGGAAGYDQCQYMHEGEHIADTASLTLQRLPVTLAANRRAHTAN